MKHTGTVRLETERLILRRFTKDDAGAVFTNWASDDEVTKYLTWPTHKTVETSQGYMDFCVNSYEDDTCYQWGIEMKETGELIGNISVVSCREDIASFELGWVIGRKWWGRGIMPEAAAEVMRFLFDEALANRVFAEHDVENPKSGRVMQKIGMKYEGTLRGAGKNNRGIVDMAVYGLLRDDR